MVCQVATFFPELNDDGVVLATAADSVSFVHGKKRITLKRTTVEK